MTIPKITPYTGGVANPDGSQTQTEFTQNMFDQLSYEANLSTELNNTVDGINDTAIQVDADATSASQSAAAAEAAASGLDYQGLWPNSGGSANKGETWQTQTGGTPTGQYFTALQNTTVNPVSDDVNWRKVISAGNTMVHYKAGSGNSAAGNMILNATPGSACVCEFGSRFKRLGNESGDIFDFELLSDLYIEDFKAPTHADDTLSWLHANNYLEGIGGGVQLLPSRRIDVSIAESTHANACVLIPENVKVKGDPFKTIITRPASERAVDGILIANKHYDTNGGYTAAGNITLDGFTITDGAVTPNRSNGDLIVLAHAKNVRAYNVHGGNHDQHLFDILACDGVYIDESCDGNNEVQSPFSSTIQIEGAATGGALGVFVDNTDTKNITVHGRKYRNTGSSRTIDLFHSGGMNYSNIVVDIDEIDAGYNPDDSCIAATSNVHDISVDGLTIKCRKVKTNNPRARHMNLTIKPTSGNTVDNVDIDINIEGQSNAPVYIGGDSASGSWETVNLKVTGSSEFVNYGTNLSWSGLRLVSINNLQLSSESSVSLTKASASTETISVQALDIISCGGTAFGGTYSLDIVDDGSGANSRVVYIHSLDPVKRMNMTTDNMNLVCGRGVGYHIYGSGGMSLDENYVKISNSTLNGEAKIANSFEQIPMLDGTNGYRQVALGEANGSRFFSASQTFTFNAGLKKRYLSPTQSGYGFKFDRQIGYGADQLGVDDVRTNTLHYISATQVSGLQIGDINVETGDFTVTTGNAGCGMSISKTTFEPVIEANARVKIFVGI